MRLEDIKQEFPEMPEKMRKMVEQEVEKQLRVVQAKGYFSVKKAVVVTLAATLVLGTTIFAGVRMYRMSQEPQGTYGVTTKITKTEAAQTQESTEALVIPEVMMKVSYLPEGMRMREEGKYDYASEPGVGGVSIMFYRMDMGDDAFEIFNTNVSESESIQVGSHDGVYLNFAALEEDETSFTKRIYVSYPEYHYVMELVAAGNVSKEEAVKIAAGVELSPVDENSEGEAVVAWNWSEYLASQKEDEALVESGEGQMKTSATAEEMKNTNQIGDAVMTAPALSEGGEFLKIRVADVTVTDQTDILNPAYCGEEISEYTDENGKLLPTTIQYIKFGDGVNTLNEIVDSRQVDRKLVYVTLEYTNTGSEDMEDVLFAPSLLRLKEQDGNYVILDGELPETDSAWDHAADVSYKGGEMDYYDVQEGESGKNYIAELKAGETKTVHVGFFVNEEELPYLFLSVDTQGGGFEFTDEGLALGYFDIRQ